jgi:hypothetical protein
MEAKFLLTATLIKCNFVQFARPAVALKDVGEAARRRVAEQNGRRDEPMQLLSREDCDCITLRNCEE